ncbi:HIT-like domain-containing protein [Radiomyces spectabilis]|uniref:HIT-like domain-containing protein n=1 Tax=Radiomyces spectabilis TaxID=64574 RepID=UPI0022210136|nr:HIT-like domain-containing protein [Radiomyces spectabilis]KAI8391582.1 HIT-like domain-containing protein [Radiomyces spectabilis]
MPYFGASFSTACLLNSDKALFSFFSLMEQLVQQKFNDALASGDVQFTEASKVRKEVGGVNFEITYAPHLGKKPQGGAAEKSDSKPNPFENPASPLIVEETDHHRILLNKFCVVPQHLLVVTKEFKDQKEPPFPEDLYETWRVMRSAYGPNRAVAFYNCGPCSGASQRHKHVQLMPLKDSGAQPPILALYTKMQDKKAGQIYTMSALPFVHVITPLDRAFIDSTSDKDILTDYLGQMFFGLLDNMFQQMRENANPMDMSYNFILTEDFMMMVPRSKEIAVIPFDGQDIELSLNSLAFAGLLLVKKQEQLEALQSHPNLMEVLQQVGIPWAPPTNPEEEKVE